MLTLDLQMPGGDGLDLLRQLADEPPVSVVVISGVTRLAAATTLRALELGAVDFVLKYTPGAPVSRASLRREIVAKVKDRRGGAAGRDGRRRAAAPAAVPAAAARRAATQPARSRRSDAAGVVIIGASTGGPRAIGELLDPAAGGLRRALRHRAAPARRRFTAPFAAQLRRTRACACASPRPATASSRPGARGAGFDAPASIRPDGRIHLQTPAPRDVYRPSIDLAMTSAADSVRRRRRSASC